MSGTDLRVGNREILLGMIVLLLFRWLLGTRGFVASEMRFGPRHVFGLSGKHFECRNAREFWNDAPAGRKAGTLWGYRGVQEVESRRLWAVEVCLFFVSSGVSEWKGRLTWNSMSMYNAKKRDDDTK